MFGGDIGFAEAYIDGDWSSPDLAAVFEFGARNMTQAGRTLDGMALLAWRSTAAHTLRANTQRGSRRNIAAHYDLGNEFYAHWLDPGDDLFVGALRSART